MPRLLGFSSRRSVIRIAALFSVLAGGTHLAHPATARATMAAPIRLGTLYCCESLDRAKSCCYWTGCAVNKDGCWKIG
jgi:hypothetical protein